MSEFRGVSEREVDFDACGVTVVEGPNEAGKSSIAEAIHLVLEERHDTTKRSVRAVKPVGRDVGTEVEIELSTGPYRLCCTKRWFSRPATELRVLEPAPEQLSGREAHERLRSILEEHLDEALWRALWVDQGGEVTQASLDGGSLGRALDVAAGGSAARELHDDLFERIVQERNKYWTATGKLLREHTDARAALDRATERVEGLRARVAELEEDAERVERLGRELAQKRETRLSHRSRLTEMRERANRVRERARNVERLEANLREADVAAKLAAHGAEARRTLLNRVESLATGLAGHESRLESEQRVESQLATRLEELNRELQEAKQATTAAETAHAAALADLTHLGELAELEQDRRRLERVQRQLEARRDALEVIESNAVTAEAFEEVDTAHQEVLAARARVEAGAATVDIEALSELTLVVDDSEETLAEADRHGLVVSGTSRIVLPGTLSLTVSAGGDVARLAEGLRDAEEQLQSICARHGVADRQDAAAAREARRDALRAREEADQLLTVDLAGSAPEELEGRIARLAQRVETFASTRGCEAPLPNNRDEAEERVRDATEASRAARDVLERVETHRDNAAAELAAHRQSMARTAEAVERTEADLAAAHEALEESRCESTDDHLERAREDAERLRLAASEELHEARVALAEDDPETIELELENAEALESRLGADIDDLEGELRDLRTKIRVRGGEGLTGQLDGALTEQSHHRERVERIMARAEAARLLHDAFLKRRNEAHERYVAPFRERIERLGRLVHGPGFEVGIDSELRINRRTLDGTTIEFDQLSIGAKEQLGIISRLAAASIAAVDGGAPVIFDDALGWSDPDRLRSMGAVIAAAARECQVIVFTCTPGRYEHVGNASVVRV